MQKMLLGLILLMLLAPIVVAEECRPATDGFCQAANLNSNSSNSYNIGNISNGSNITVNIGQPDDFVLVYLDDYFYLNNTKNITWPKWDNDPGTGFYWHYFVLGTWTFGDDVQSSYNKLPSYWSNVNQKVAHACIGVGADLLCSGLGNSFTIPNSNLSPGLHTLKFRLFNTMTDNTFMAVKLGYINSSNVNSEFKFIVKGKNDIICSSDTEHALGMACNGTGVNTVTISGAGSNTAYVYDLNVTFYVPPIPLPDDSCTYNGTTYSNGSTAVAGCNTLGTCAGATKTCNNGTWSNCSILPRYSTEEWCDGSDEDCDGSTDDEFNINSICPVGVGACQTNGIVACSGGKTTRCVGNPLSPGTETCDGTDEDCDGLTDEENVCACTGTIDSNAQMYSEDNVNVTFNDITNVLVDTDTARKCEYHCKTGYYRNGVNCIPEGPDPKCTMNVPNNSLLCNADGETLTALPNISRTVVENISSCTTKKCQYYCEEFFHTNGNNCEKNICNYSGLISANTIDCPNNSKNVATNNLQGTLLGLSSDCSSSGKCEKYCSPTYIIVNETICEKNPTNCTQAIAQNSVPCNSLDAATQTPWSLVSTCASAPCTARCKTGYTFFSGSCILQTLVNAKPSITSITGVFDGNDKINLSYSCDKNIKNSNINAIETSLGVTQPNEYTRTALVDCNTNVLQTILNEVPQDKVIQVNLTISAPCEVCSKTIFVSTSEKKLDSNNIPDNSIILVILTFLTIAFFLQKKK